MEFVVLLIALSTSAPAFFPFELQARMPLDDFGVFQLEQSPVVSFNVLKFRVFRLYGITSNTQSYTFFRFIRDVGDEVVLIGDEELSTFAVAPLISNLCLMVCVKYVD